MKAAISMAENPQFHGRAKHIGIKYHFVREQVTNGTVELKYCETENMVAEMLTKGLCHDSSLEYWLVSRSRRTSPPASEKECWRNLSHFRWTAYSHVCCIYIVVLCCTLCMFTSLSCVLCPFLTVSFGFFVVLTILIS